MDRILDTSLVSIDPMQLDHPEFADQFAIGANEQGPIRHAAFTTARSATEALFGIAQKLSAAEQSIRHLGDKPDAATDARLRRGARQQMQAGRAALDAAYKALGDHAATMEAEAEDAIGTEHARVGVTENARGAEVRAWLRTLAPAQRASALDEAIRAGDREIVASVLAATPILSGMKRDAHTELRSEARAKFAPDQHRLLNGIDRLFGMLRTADTTITKRFASITGEGSSRQAAVERSLSALETGGAA